MISPEAAWRQIVATLEPLPAVAQPFDKKQPLSEALGAYLTRPVVADRDIPATDRAAMDGYAVRSVDVASVPVALRVVGEVAAGAAQRPALGPGECVRIMTGASVPPDADAVVRIEETEPVAGDHINDDHVDNDQDDAGHVNDGLVRILAPVRAGQDILRRAENARCGDALLPEGARLTAQAIAVCAAVGVVHPQVGERPRVAVITTGSELCDPAEAVAAHQIRDANGPLVVASLIEQGFAVAPLTRVPDDRDQLLAVVGRSVAEYRVSVVSGGVSVGRYDFVPEVVRALGGTVLVHGVAMKPGKPLLCARFDSGHLLFGLPGNPLAALTGLHEFVLPALRRLAGCPLAACRPQVRLPLGAALRYGGARRQYHLARVDDGPTGLTAWALPSSGSADFVAAGQADGMIISPEGSGLLPAGALVDIRPWR